MCGEIGEIEPNRDRGSKSGEIPASSRPVVHRIWDDVELHGSKTAHRSGMWLAEVTSTHVPSPVGAASPLDSTASSQVFLDTSSKTMREGSSPMAIRMSAEMADSVLLPSWSAPPPARENASSRVAGGECHRLRETLAGVVKGRAPLPLRYAR